MSAIQAAANLLEELRTSEDASVASIRARSRQALDALRNPPVERVTIFCGSEQPFTAADCYEHHPPPLVMFLGLDEVPTQPRRQKPRKSSGCGAQIHVAAQPLPNYRWGGDFEGVSGIVIALEDEYISPETAASLVVPQPDSCECVHGFVGCAVCGNAVGIRLMPYSTHISHKSSRVYTFLPSAVSPPFPSSPLANSPL
ncbi:hypothetical protein B0H13DRAFT_2379542 [Mycena leptocephala]|nr:hypothetical protein B0H13DRAFT_2379542 [Mycena leptocephala]